MFDRILAHFPVPGHALTLVHDPDNLLGDEAVLAALGERGYSLVRELDPIELRYRVNQTGFDSERPLIVATTEELNRLPYDLWQQGYHVVLPLPRFFPHYSAPVVRALTPEQRWRLSQSPAPARKLGRQATMRYVLHHVFGADPAQLWQPARLIAWLNDLYQQPEPLPPMLADFLLAQLQPLSQYGEWPLAAILSDRATFKRFVDEQWRAYLQQETGEKLLGETAVTYVLPFAQDQGLQDTVSALVRSHVLERVALPRLERLAPWAVTAVQSQGEAPLPQRLAEALQALAGAATDLEATRWPQWQSIAVIWADVTNLRYHPDAHLPEATLAEFGGWQEKLDAAFQVWLQSRYAALAVQKLPTPHHLYHVPHVMNHRWSRQQGIALLILDGLSLAKWQLVRRAWQSRRPAWRLEAQLLLAQIPTITAVSRQALVSGLRPADFAPTIGHNREEPKLWRAFWERQGIPGQRCYYGRLHLERPLPPELSDPRHYVLCLLVNDVDEHMVHKAGLGMADSQSSLLLWLKERSPRLENAIDALLQRGFTVYLASDHGHTEATGAGRPPESRLLVETRSQRARLYSDRLQAQSLQAAYPQSTLWQGDGLLPEGMVALMSNGRLAFATEGSKVVTHGGTSVDEVVVPFVRITTT